MKSSRTIFNLLLSALISAVILALLFRLVNQSSTHGRPWTDVLRSTSTKAVVAYTIFSLLQAAFRASRFRVIIRAEDGVMAPGLGQTFLVTLVRNMTVDLLPGRIGELSYIAMMNRGYRVRGEYCVSSLAISFVFDLVALLGVIATLGFAQWMTGALEVAVVHLLLVLVVIAAILSAVVLWGVRPMIGIGRLVLGPLGKTKLFSVAFAFLEHVSDAIASARRSRIMLRVLALSLGVRIAKYTALYLLFRGVAAGAFPEFDGAPPLQVLFGLIGGEAGASLALPTLMGFGSYEAGSMFALAWLGYSAAAAATLMLVVHIWSQIVDYTLGGLALIGFCCQQRPSSRASQQSGATKTIIVVAIAALLGLSAAAVVGWQWRSSKKSGASAAPPAGQAIRPSAEAAGQTKSLTSQLRGFLVWSSNREGNHNIVRYDLPGGKLRFLTDNPHTDTFPRISPSGEYIVFARSQRPWVSQRDELGWDVYIMDADGRHERLLAQHGNVPTWSPDGQRVYFQRYGTTVVAHDLKSGREQIVFDVEPAGLPSDTHLQTPSVSAAGTTLAATLRKGKRGTVTLDDNGRIRKLGGGCQLTWGPGDRYLYYIDRGGLKKNQVFRVDPQTFSRTPWLDLPGDFSHEYFPRVSPDGKYMVIGGAAEGHEHDTADYEIFLWVIGQPAASAVRISYHNGNDCWPDIFTR
ncbi:MAG: lysylphosphatidylglycerol synthase domain-containing protein [Verrucomicrobia bacterium]|nr:lysylphosphatidylglycerol synthase domain-containing protein [Verrucomicrobiota bacterium]